ncbi:MAG: glycosyltransferase family 2 protein [Candidatus Onthomonas sp.]
MMNDKISVIVPIYNVEPYLRKCVDSILAQTYQNLEIILVDDGSPDSCGAICDEYAKKDSRVTVIHKSNGGLSDARNAGLDVITGNYVAFVDSDDWIEAQMYEKLLGYLKHFNADIALGGVADEWEHDGTITTVKVSDYGCTPFAVNPIEAMRRYFHGSWAAWDKLYKAELFQDVRYPVGEINEDEAIVLHLLSKCSCICYTNEIFYHYMKRPSHRSITISDFSVKKLAWQKHCADNLKFIQKNYPELEADAAARYRDSLLWSLTEIALSNDDFTDQIKDLRSELRDHYSHFKSVPFAYPQDRVRLELLTRLPFCIYRLFIRLKRKSSL